MVAETITTTIIITITLTVVVVMITESNMVEVEMITTPQAMGTVDAEDEYLAPDIDHFKATQKAIKESISGLGDNYQADYNDWSKEDQQVYQEEMNKLKGTENVNYSFYAGNEGTTNLKF